MLEIENTYTKLKTTFGGLISRLDMAETRISNLEDITMQTFKPKNREKGVNENKTETNKNCAVTIMFIRNAMHSFTCFTCTTSFNHHNDSVG